jgi:signal transduction histidine kinase
VTLVIFFLFKKENYSKGIRKERLRNSVSKELYAVIITQEERKRIAQDLHDDISSKLNIVSLNSYLRPNLTENETLGITKL